MNTNNLDPAFAQPLEDLGGHSQEHGRLLAEWCRINSGSRNPEGLERMRAKLEESFFRLPGECGCLPVEGASEAKIARVRCRPEAPVQVVLAGHYDTVYGPDHPFQEVKWKDANTIHAPGAADMKGGLLVMLKALEHFERFPGKDGLGWEVLLTPDEEIGSRGSFPVLREAARRAHLGLVFEPAMPDGSVVRRRKGGGVFRARVKGRAAHTGRDYARGRNAIAALSRFVLAVEGLNGKFPGGVFAAVNISGGGPTNVVPDEAEALFNIRVERASDLVAVKEKLSGLLAEANRQEGFEVFWEGDFNRPPKEIGPGEEAAFSRLQSCARDLGWELAWSDSGGGSDGNFFAAEGLPTLDGLGVRGGNLHSAEEIASVGSVAERAAVLALFLMREAREDASAT